MEGGREVWQGPQHHRKHLQAEECSPRCDLSKKPEDEVEDDEKGRTSGRGNQCFNRKNWDSLRPLLPVSLWVTMVTSFQDDHS